MRERLINRSRQGAIGEASAIEWLTSVGATVFVPFGPSQDCDLVVQIGGRLLRIQVKTSTCRTRTSKGAERWEVQLATSGGNQSWSGLTKKFDPNRVDFVFALVGNGRRWFIPASSLDVERRINLGGPKYSEFEIDPGIPIECAVYGSPEKPSRIDSPARGSAGVGEPGQTVNLVPKLLSGFESLLPHSPESDLEARARFRPTKYERRLGKSGQAVINQKRRVTLPQVAVLAAGLCDGDRVVAQADGPGRIVLEKTGLPVWAERERRGEPAKPARPCDMPALDGLHPADP
jgi:hypothetical protein